jgi:hypothetical protein
MKRKESIPLFYNEVGGKRTMANQYENAQETDCRNVKLLFSVTKHYKQKK